MKLFLSIASIILVVSLAACTTTTGLIYSEEHSVVTEEVEDIRGNLSVERFILNKDIATFQQTVVTVERVSVADEPSAVANHAIGIRYDGQGWQFYEGIILAINGETVELTTDTHNRQTVSGSRVKETVVVPIDQETVEELAQADSLRLQYIGQYRYEPLTIPPEGIDALRQFLRKE